MIIVSCVQSLMTMGKTSSGEIILKAIPKEEARESVTIILGFQTNHFADGLVPNSLQTGLLQWIQKTRWSMITSSRLTIKVGTVFPYLDTAEDQYLTRGLSVLHRHMDTLVEAKDWSASEFHFSCNQNA